MTDEAAYYRAAQRTAAAMAAAGMGGLYELVAFLSKWGNSEEINQHLVAHARLSRWWVERGGDGATADHLTATLERLQTMYATARRAERELGECGGVFKDGMVKVKTGGRGAPTKLYRLLIKDAAERLSLTGKGQHSDATAPLLRRHLQYTLPPEELTDTRINSAIGYHAPKVKQTRRTPRPG